MTTAVASTRTAFPARASNLARDVGIVMLRELRPVLHDPFSLIFGMVQPLVFLALFGPLLAGSVGNAIGGPFGSVGFGYALSMQKHT